VRARWIVPCLAAVVALAGCLVPLSSSPRDSLGADEVSRTFETIVLETNIGVIEIVLYPAAAPRTVEHMKTLVAEGYYDGREFNRVVPGHVIQLVDKAGGVTDDPRRLPLETHPEHHFAAGAAGIARSADPDSGGPEFFLMDYATSHLDGNYTLWGQTVRGLDVIHRCARVEAIEWTTLLAPLPPDARAAPSDRTAVVPCTIARARVSQSVLAPEVASRYPLKVAQNHREGDFRHSLEWPRDLRAGVERDLTWYVRPYNGSAPPEASRVTIEVDGRTHAPQGDREAEGAFHWRFAPSAPGTHEAVFRVDGRAVGRLAIEVPA